MLFYVAVHKDENSVYGVTVPALAGCNSWGDTFEDALKNTKEAILDHLEICLEDEQEPDIKKVELEVLQKNSDYAGAIWAAVEVDLTDMSLKSERFNVSWPKYVLSQVDAYVKEHHEMSRSKFLARIALEVIQHK